MKNMINTIYRFKVEIKFDEDKIIEEGKYSIDNIYSATRSAFESKDMEEIISADNDLVFISNRQDNLICAESMSVLLQIMKRDWFKPYVTKLFWYNSDESEDYYEDIIHEFEKAGW